MAKLESWVKDGIQEYISKGFELPDILKQYPDQDQKKIKAFHYYKTHLKKNIKIHSEESEIEEQELTLQDQIKIIFNDEAQKYLSEGQTYIASIVLSLWNKVDDLIIFQQGENNE
jgi:hypothetical protein